MLVTELLTPGRVKIPLRSRSKDDLLRELVELAAADRGTATVDIVLAAVREREALLSTGIGAGVAIPHGKTPVVDQLVMAAGVAPEGVDFDALDGEPVHLFFLLVGPERAAGAHIKALSRISRLLRHDSLRQSLRASRDDAEFLALVRESEAP